MSDAAFNAMMNQIDNFSAVQKKALIRALKKSVWNSAFSKIFKNKTDNRLLERLVGVAGNEDISLKQIKEDRLAER